MTRADQRRAARDSGTWRGAKAGRLRKPTSSDGAKELEELDRKPGNRALRRYVVHFRGWPGIEGLEFTNRLPVYSPRLADRLGLVIVAASELGTEAERFGLGAYLVVHGRTVIRGRDHRPRRHRRNEPRRHHRMGRKRLSERPVDDFVGRYPAVRVLRSPLGDLHQRAYSGAGWCIGADLGRTFGLMAEHVVPRRGPNQDSWDLWMPGWGTRGERGNVHRASPHRPCLRVESRRVGWQGLLRTVPRENGKASRR